MYKSNVTRLLAILLIACIAVPIFEAAAIGRPRRHRSSTPHTKSTLQRRLKAKSQQIKVLKKKMAQVEVQRKDVLGQLSNTEQRLDAARESLSKNKIQLTNAENDLRVTKARLARTIKQLARRKELLARRVVDIYEGEDVNYLDVILGSSDMWTLLTRAYYFQRILNADTTLIKGINADKKSIEKDKVHQDQLVKSISTKQVQLVAQANEISDLVIRKRSTLQAIENDQELMQKALDELEAESNRIEGQIVAFQNTEAARRRDRIAAQQNRITPGKPPIPGQVPNMPIRGGLSFPCSGRITSRFAYRYHPITHIYKLHTGVDIGVPSGTPIHAAADGTVMQAQYNKAYGYMVVIYHGNGVSTLYGHNSRLLVHAGQEVRRGQLIAMSGSTGYSTGPHCHFEKRINGTPVNPLAN